MPESLFEEIIRYVRFGPEDAAALRALHGHAEPHFRRIAERFYTRLSEHSDAKAVFAGQEQVERLKGTLVLWLDLLLAGPWDEAYFLKRARIGRMHVRIALPQRYMFAAMNIVRLDLQQIIDGLEGPGDERERTHRAVDKILDLELAIMLETYREAWVEKIQESERREKAGLEEQLALSEARADEIVERGWMLITTFDEEGRIQVFNPRCEDLTGRARGGALGGDWLETFVHRDDHERVRALIRQVLVGELRVGDYEGRVPRAAGPEHRVRWHLITLPGSGNRVLCGMGVDVTEQHDLGVRTRRAERLAALGTMAAGLAHEIRNPLNAALLQLTVVQRRLARIQGPEVSGATESAQLVANEMVRLGRIVEEFLQFARPRALRLVEGGLHLTAQEVVALLRPEAEAAGIALEVSPAEPSFVQFDDERVRQVLINLVRNAIEAVPRGGHVRVGVRRHPEGAVLEVEDDGPGLPADQSLIFEPFFTTKEAGTGLGLAIVHRIVADHGGRVSVESRAGCTRFTVSLPYHE